MLKGKHLLKLVSVLLILTLIASLAGCIAVDNSSENASQNVETEYRHIKNTYHNYINSSDSGNSSNSNNDSSDFEESEDSEFLPDSVTPNTGNTNQDNSSNEEESDELPPEINYDDVLTVPETEIFSDNFEGYGENGTFIVKYTMSGGDEVVPNVSNDAIEGNYSGKFSRTYGASKWAAIYYDFSGNTSDYNFQNWKDQKYLSFWAKSNQNENLLFGVFDGVHESWCKVATTNEWTFYSIKLSDFLHKDFILENVTKVGMTWGGATASTWIDDIRITENEIKQYNKYIPVGNATTVENGEYYEGDDLGVKAAYSLLEGEKYSTTAVVGLDSAEKKTGDYSIKFLSKPEDGKDTAVYTAKLGQTMVVSDFNEVKLSLKGNGIADQKVDVMLYDGNTQVAGASFNVSSNWAEYKIPVSIAENSINVKFDHIVLATPLADNDSIFWLDDFVIANKEGVLTTPDDVIENGEFYSEAYTVENAYKGDTTLPVVNVSLDTSNKYAGDHSVKFSLPVVGQNIATPPVANKKYIQNDKTVNVSASGSVTEVTFDSPIDCSGTDGNIIVTGSEESGGDIAYYLWIYTSNKTSSRYYKRYGVNDKDVTISLDALGLSDNDLQSVTGYKIQIWYRGGGTLDYTFSIYANEKVNVADANSSILTYDFQPKSIANGTHFKFQLYGDGKSEKQTVIMELYSTDGTLIASEEKEFVSDGNWKELYLTNVTTVDTTAKTLKLIFPLTDVTREIWLDDFVSFVPQEPTVDNPDVIDEFEHYNGFYPPQNYTTYEKSGGYDTNMFVALTDGSDEFGKVHSGKQALKVSSKDFNKGGVWYATAYQSFEGRNVVLNEGDKVSLWVALTQDTSTEIKINIETTNGMTGWQKIRVSDSEWHEMEIDISAKAAGTVTKIWYFISNEHGVQVTYCVDDIVITRN